MRQIIRRATRALACVAVTAGGALGPATPAGAAPPSVPAEPVPAARSTVTLPLLGAPVMVDVTTDASGGLLDVTLSPSDTATPNSVHLNHVSFVSEGGTVTLKVAAVRGGERVSARAGSLADISGPGRWSGDVFATGALTEVGYTVTATAEGGPDITGVTVNSPLDHTIGEVKFDHAGDSRSAKLTIEFTDQGQKRWLTIKATAQTGADGDDDDGGDGDGDAGESDADHDDDGASAGVRVSLSHPWGPRLAEGDAVGEHMWAGTLCDGTTATVDYTVAESGEITDVTTTPAAEVRTTGRFAWVGFDWLQGVSLFTHDGNDGLQVGAIDKIQCAPAAPTVDGEASDTARPPGQAQRNDHASGGRRGNRNGADPGRHDQPGESFTDGWLGGAGG